MTAAATEKSSSTNDDHGGDLEDPAAVATQIAPLLFDKAKAPPPPDPSCMVPQLEAYGVTYGDLQTAITVLNAVASLNPKTNKKRLGANTSVSSSVSKDDPHQDDKDDDVILAQYKQSNLRPFRKALASCLDLHQRTMFQGVAESEHYDQRIQERSLKRQKLAEKDLYKKHIATTALRKGRVDRLQAALDEGVSEERDKQQLAAIQAMMVPDGHVDTGSAPAMQLENGETVQLPCLRSCYVCKIRYRELHPFYDQLCPDCAAVNWEKRGQTADMKGRVAVVTGSRVKIGYQVCLKLLRAGCTVIATTRFPNAAVDIYRHEADFDTWKENLHVYGLDLRDVAGLEAFTRFLKSQFAETTGVDVLINNACQTIRRPAGYYRPAIEKEQQLWSTADDTHCQLLKSCIQYERLRRRIVLDQKIQQASGTPTTAATNQQLLLPIPTFTATATTTTSIGDAETTENNTNNANGAASSIIVSTSSEERADLDQVALSSAALIEAPFETTGLSHSAAMSQMIILPEDAGVSADILPPGVSDINGQQLDLRATNSWLLKMEEVSTPELMECMFVNAIAPFVLNSRLKPLMALPADNSRPDRYIINVSAMEGKVSLFRPREIFIFGSTPFVND